jgi:ABC-type Mn2+/Zn2+ transport system permease subunit
VTGVDTGDLGRQAIATVVALAGVAVFYRAFLVMTFDETQAQLLGLRPRLAHVVLLVLLALTIVASFEVVGNLLVFAFLVAPPAAATLLVRRVPWIMATALVLGSLSVVIGLLISYHRSTAAGATMALVSVVVFVAVLGLNGLRQNLRVGSKVTLS